MLKHIALFLLVGLISCVSTHLAVGQEGKAFQTKLAEAQAAVAESKLELEQRTELFKTGSASLSEVRRAQYRFDKATINLAMLVEPENRKANELLSAKLDANLAQFECEQQKKLYVRGSASKHDYQRARYLQTISDLRVSLLENIENQKKADTIRLHIAWEKVKLTCDEFDDHNRLHARGACTLQELNRARASMEIAKTEYDARKEALGASAEVIDNSK